MSNAQTHLEDPRWDEEQTALDEYDPQTNGLSILAQDPCLWWWLDE